MNQSIDRRFVLKLAGGAALAVALPASAEQGEFVDWLRDFRAEATTEGIGRETLAAALDGLKPLDRVLELDRHQPESTATFAQYIDRTVSAKRVASGRDRLAENRQLLSEIGARYGVQPRFIVALWGLETDFGAVTGNTPVVAALATLAWASSRPDMFRAELLAALRILDKGRIRPDELRGSWAGAMGQTQFMPSSYLKYAVDFRGKGRADIWADRADVFASIANYLSHEGWNGAFTWGREVRLPSGFSSDLLGGKTLRSVESWQALGVRREDGGDLPRAALEAGLVQPGGAEGPTLMTYGNYRVIMKWNRSTYFATSVSYLADRIAV